MLYSIKLEKHVRGDDKIASSTVKWEWLNKFYDFKKAFPEYLKMAMEQEQKKGTYYTIAMEKENKKGFFARYYFTIYSDGTFHKHCIAGGGICAEYEIDHVGFELSLEKNLKLYNYRERR